MIKPKKRGAYQPSGAPWNDGGRSFFTKEHLAVQTEDGRKWRFFKKKALFSQFLGDVLRTLCWAANAL
jgi:hypothetical protein